MAKNVVVCCDGTANEFERAHTNVHKLFYALELRAPEAQVAYYRPGLGTMAPPGALTGIARFVTKLLGKMFGYGLSADVCAAYGFVMNTYEPGDRLFLFGFSRGAYVVRAVAALLYMYGLIRKGNETLVPYAARMLTRGLDKNGPARDFGQAGDFRETFGGAACAPHFVGVWDTVSSVGWFWTPLRMYFTATNPDIAIGRHAIAIDERRAFFRTNLWRPSNVPAYSGPRDLKQVWFAGVHSDIGGGYPEPESGLSKLAFEWMLCEARDHGLLLRDVRVRQVLGGGDRYAAPDPEAQMHDSMKGFWPLAELLPKPHYNWRTGQEERRPNWWRRRTIPRGALVHESVFRRHGYDPGLAARDDLQREPWRRCFGPAADG